MRSSSPCVTARSLRHGLALGVITVMALRAPVVEAQPGLPLAPGAHVATASPPGAEEPGIAVNPRSPNQVVVAFQFPGRVAYSTDSGRTFAPAQIAAAADWHGVPFGDVTTTFDVHGHAWLSYLAWDTTGPARTPYYWGRRGTANGVFLRRSVDGGKTWGADPVIVWQQPRLPNTPFADMERLFTDNGPKSPFAGNLYVGWIQWQLDSSVMLFSRSTDDGRTWTAPARLSTKAGLPRDGNGDVVGFYGATGPDGAVYTVWDRGHSIDFTSSHDGGQTFAPSRSIIEIGPSYMGTLTDLSPYFGALGCPQIAVDPRNGTLYVTWSDYRNGDVDVFIARSTDGGLTWSKAARVNDDPIHDGADQFFQAMAVDPVTGAIYVQFYDRRGDPENRKTGITLARSTDGGRTFMNYAWTETPFELHGVRVGDYMWLAAYDNRVYGAWAEAAPSAAATAAGSGGPPSVSSSYRPFIRVGSADFSGHR